MGKRLRVNCLLQLQALLAASVNGYSSHIARRCVLSVLLAWPAELRCTSKVLGGVDRLISLAKLVAAGLSTCVLALDFFCMPACTCCQVRECLRICLDPVSVTPRAPLLSLRPFDVNCPGSCHKRMCPRRMKAIRSVSCVIPLLLIVAPDTHAPPPFPYTHSLSH